MVTKEQGWASVLGLVLAQAGVETVINWAEGVSLVLSFQVQHSLGALGSGWVGSRLVHFIYCERVVMIGLRKGKDFAERNNK